MKAFGFRYRGIGRGYNGAHPTALPSAGKGHAK
jgi:hypothetical protein